MSATHELRFANDAAGAHSLHRLVVLLDKLQEQREAISDYGYRTGRTNDRTIESMEGEYMRIGVQLNDEWREVKQHNNKLRRGGE